MRLLREIKWNRNGKGLDYRGVISYQRVSFRDYEGFSDVSIVQRLGKVRVWKKFLVLRLLVILLRRGLVLLWVQNLNQIGLRGEIGKQVLDYFFFKEFRSKQISGEIGDLREGLYNVAKYFQKMGGRGRRFRVQVKRLVLLVK